MSEESSSRLPRNAIEAQGLLIKAFYGKYGDDILPIVDHVLGLQGKALGLRVKKKLQDTRLSAVGDAFAKNFDSEFTQVTVSNDREFRIRGTQCPFGLENTSRQLCEAVMAIDREYFLAATGGRTRLEILTTRAEGNEICDTCYTVAADGKP